jgi:hypothetical protein
MKTPVSPYFTPISLTDAFTADHQTLTEGLRAPRDLGDLTGQQSFAGIPFMLGQPGEKNVILLEKQEVHIAIDNTATYLLFLHAVEDRVTNYLDGLADFSVDGNELGDLVADYTLEYEDGSHLAAFCHSAESDRLGRQCLCCNSRPQSGRICNVDRRADPGPDTNRPIWTRRDAPCGRA